MKSRPIYIVEWEDPSGTASWLTEEEVKKRTPLRCTSVGVIVDKNAHHMTMAGTICEENNTFSDTTTIPRNAVCRMKKIGSMTSKSGKR